jgi:hypothetical protein
MFNTTTFATWPQHPRNFLQNSSQRRYCHASTSAPPERAGGAAKDVIIRFYDSYNAGNVDAVMELMDDDCEYFDMIYPSAFRGAAAIRFPRCFVT